MFICTLCLWDSGVLKEFVRTTSSYCSFDIDSFFAVPFSNLRGYFNEVLHSQDYSELVKVELLSVPPFREAPIEGDMIKVEYNGRTMYKVLMAEGNTEYRLTI